MDNKDFSRLLESNDQTVIADLRRRPRKRARGGWYDNEDAPAQLDSDEEEARQQRVADDKRKKEKAEEWKRKRLAAKEKNVDDKDVGKEVHIRDRAKERRLGEGEYKTIAEEFEQQEKVTVEASKFLGGDMDHTHLVKGLDYALLGKINQELQKFEKAKAAQKAAEERKREKDRRYEFKTIVGKGTYQVLLEILHPHHRHFRQRLSHMTKCVSKGQRIRGAPLIFQPGFLNYEYDVELPMGIQDIPKFITRAKEECPKPDFSTKPAYFSDVTIKHLEDCFKDVKARQRAKKDAEERIKRKKARLAAGRPEDDIFVGAGGVSITDIIRPKKKDVTSSANPSYFDDDFVVSKKKKHDEASEDFIPTDKYLGARKGYVYKRGDLGLGYYREDRVTPQDKQIQALKAQRLMAKVSMDDDGAYGELFPTSRLYEHKTKEEMPEDKTEDKKKKDDGEMNRREKRKAEKEKRKRGGDSSDDGKKSDKYGTEGSKVYGSKHNIQEGRQKKGKLNEEKQWEKIEDMMKSGSIKSIGQMEREATKKKK